MTTSTLVKVESVDIIPIPVSRHSREYQPLSVNFFIPVPKIWESQDKKVPARILELGREIIFHLLWEFFDLNIPHCVGH